MIFTREDWDRLATLFVGVRPGMPHDNRLAPYSGYKPGTVEAPNGDTKVCPECDRDGRPMVDCQVPGCNGSGRVPNTDAAGVCPECKGTGDYARHSIEWQPGGCAYCKGTGRVQGKRYLHVADKYPDAPDWARAYQDRAYARAARVATALGVPAAYFPRPEYGALRVLEYPAGAGSTEHTDLDLFTVLCWRETPSDLEICNPAWSIGGPRNWHPTIAGRLTNEAEALVRGRERALALSPGLHIGELGELVGLGPATPHRVPARPYVQRSIVYFAIPDHAARLPCTTCLRGGTLEAHKAIGCAGEACGFGLTVGEWLSERMARSRYEASR